MEHARKKETIPLWDWIYNDLECEMKLLSDDESICGRGERGLWHLEFTLQYLTREILDEMKKSSHDRKEKATADPLKGSREPINGRRIEGEERREGERGREGGGGNVLRVIYCPMAVRRWGREEANGLLPATSSLLLPSFPLHRWNGH